MGGVAGKGCIVGGAWSAVYVDAGTQFRACKARHAVCGPCPACIPMVCKGYVRMCALVAGSLTWPQPAWSARGRARCAGSPKPSAILCPVACRATRAAPYMLAELQTLRSCRYVDKAAYEEVHKTSEYMQRFTQATAGIRVQVQGERAPRRAAPRCAAWPLLCASSCRRLLCWQPCAGPPGLVGDLGQGRLSPLRHHTLLLVVKGRAARALTMSCLVPTTPHRRNGPPITSRTPSGL